MKLNFCITPALVDWLKKLWCFLLMPHAGTKQKQIIKSLIKINLCPAEKRRRRKIKENSRKRKQNKIVKSFRGEVQERDFCVFVPCFLPMLRWVVEGSQRTHNVKHILNNLC
ncbi:CLUMA_CG007811, isoform A [Clunio marinus]|uniref:CLUMA_CG007811, isoform A n=1 Tax=Clunio marinus TaxID=568069 RepID=A0A1J1I1U4_9DIPT|nr:CLUMA_CG007811, isoform A [Clunio marinus]